MGLFGFKLSRTKKASPERSPADENAAGPTTIEERLDDLEHDSREAITAINRIERKQNRWLEVLNVQDRPETGEKQPAAAGDNGNAGSEEYE